MSIKTEADEQVIVSLYEIRGQNSDHQSLKTSVKSLEQVGKGVPLMKCVL